MKKALLVMIAAAVMVIACCMTSFAGWEQDGAQYKYLDQNGNYVVNRIETIDGVKYGFDAAGHMVKGWMKDGNNWYYFDPAIGAQKTGWVQDGGKWYYMTPATGAMTTGFIDIGNKRYCCGDDGVMKTGQFQYGDFWYMTDTDGSLLRNKVQTLDDGRSLKFDDAGVTYYKNAKSRTTDNSEWLLYTSTAKQDFDYVNYGNAVADILQKYYERYKSSMASKKSAAERNAYKKEWEARVRSELAATEAEEVAPGITASYIRDVERNRYKDYTDYYEKFYSEDE